jgi:hypothetical protein
LKDQIEKYYLYKLKTRIKMKINKILTKKKSENNTEITTKRTKSEMPIIMRTIDIIKKKNKLP